MHPRSCNEDPGKAEPDRQMPKAAHAQKRPGSASNHPKLQLNDGPDDRRGQRRRSGTAAVSGHDLCGGSETIRGTVFPTIGQSFNRPNLISVQLRRLEHLLSYFAAFRRSCGRQDGIGPGFGNGIMTPSGGHGAVGRDAGQS